MLIQEDYPNLNEKKISSIQESNRIKHDPNDSSHLLCSFVWWTALSLIASILIAAGFWLPYWIRGFYDNISFSFSPFRRCNFPVLDEQGNVQIMFKCIRYKSFTDIPYFSWKLTTILVGLGVLFSVLVALILLFSCCMPRALTSSNTFSLVLLQLLIILVTITGCMLYPLGWNHQEIQNVCGVSNGNRPFQLEKCHLSLSIYLLTAGVLLLFTCLIFGLITSRKFRNCHC